MSETGVDLGLMAADPKQITPAGIPRSVLRRMVLAHGGEFHGPRVEHLSMEEEAFWRFLDQLIDIAWRRQRPEVL